MVMPRNYRVGAFALFALSAFFIIFAFTELDIVVDSLSHLGISQQHSDIHRSMQTSLSNDQSSNNETFILKLVDKIVRGQDVKGMMSLIGRGQIPQYVLHKFFSQNKHKLSDKEYEEVMFLLEEYKRRLPGAVIIGCKKCGTTFFRRLFLLHPNVAGHPFEVNFFDKTSEQYLTAKDYVWEMPPSFPDQITIEKTPSYWISDHIAAEMREMLPEVKLILLVRDPACRVVSDYKHAVRNEILQPGDRLEDVLTETHFSKKRDRLLLPSLYDEHMTRWLSSFPSLSQFLVIRYEDLTSNKFVEILSETESFLGIPHYFSPVYNEEKGELCVVNSLLEKEECVQIRDETDKCSYEKEYDTALKELREELKPRVEKFEQLVDREFDWF